MIRSDGQYVRDYFYVEDGAAAYMLLAEELLLQPAELHGQAFNFSNEIQVTVLEPGEPDSRATWGRTLEPEIRERGVERDPPPVF